MSDYRGRFVWHELLTTDPKAAGAFFSKIIGWKTQPWGNDQSYTLFVAGGRQLAGLMAQPEEAKKMGAPPSWMTYIATNDVDDTARLASSLGAKVLKAPEDIPGAGRYAVLQDPQGAVFGLYKSNQAPAADSVPGVGDFSWHELATTDAKAALTFYQRLFGWEETSAMDLGGGMGIYQMFGQSKQGPTLGGMFNKPSQMPGPSAWLAYIKVPDARKSAEAIKKAGANVVNGPMEVPGGDWIAQAVDPQGAMFAVHSAAAAPATAVSSKPAAAAPSKPAVSSAKKAAPQKKSAPKKSASKKSAPSKSAPKKAAKKARKASPARRAAQRSAKKKSVGKAKRGKKK